MRFSTISLLAVVAVADAASSGSSRRTMMPWALPRGGASSYASKLEAVKEKVLASTLPSVRTVYNVPLFCFEFRRMANLVVV